MVEARHAVARPGQAERPSSQQDVKTARRVCFFAHHDIDDIVDPYVLYYLEALGDAGFTTVLATTSRLNKTEVAKLSGLCADVILRENVGLDFGGWADCLARYPNLSAELLLLCNDSVYGPFWSLAEFIDDLTAEPADFYGAVLSVADGEKCPEHLQSWFILFRSAAYNSPAFRSLLKPVPSTLNKDEIISHYECRLTQNLATTGLVYRAAFDCRNRGLLLSRHHLDPSFVLWRELLERRILPFLKVRLLRDRPIWARGLDEWRATATAINADVTDLAAANTARRTRGQVGKPFERLRDYAYMLTGTGAYLPFYKRLLVEDMDYHAGRQTISGASPASRFARRRKLHRALLRPYAAAYRALSRFRGRTAR